jgi:hypothetical protein
MEALHAFAMGIVVEASIGHHAIDVQKQMLNQGATIAKASVRG